MLSLDATRSKRTAMSAASIDADNHTGSARSTSPEKSVHNIGDTSYERRQMPQEDLETILLQLQNDLIETVRMVRPSRDRLGHRSLDDESTEGGIELAIKTCINSCLSKWSPPSKRNSSSQAETSTSQITGTFDSTLLSDGTGSVASSATKHFNNHTSEGQNKSSTLAQIPEPQPPAGPILPPHIINEIRRLIRQELLATPVLNDHSKSSKSDTPAVGLSQADTRPRNTSHDRTRFSDVITINKAIQDNSNNGPRSLTIVASSASDQAPTPAMTPKANSNTSSNISTKPTELITPEFPHSQSCDNYSQDHTQSFSTDCTSLESSADRDPKNLETQQIGQVNKKDWRTHRGVLKNLYLSQRKPLAEVMKIMADKYNFKPTAKQYRYQLVKWGWKKYNVGGYRLPLNPSDFNELSGRHLGTTTYPNAFDPPLPDEAYTQPEDWMLTQNSGQDSASYCSAISEKPALQQDSDSTSDYMKSNLDMDNMYLVDSSDQRRQSRITENWEMSYDLPTG